MGKKTERIIIRVTKEELEKLQEIADIEEKSVSEVIRGLIKYRANHYEKNGLNNPVSRANSKAKTSNLMSIDWLNKEPTNEELYQELISKIH